MNVCMLFKDIPRSKALSESKMVRCIPVNTYYLAYGYYYHGAISTEREARENNEISNTQI